MIQPERNLASKMVFSAALISKMISVSRSSGSSVTRIAGPKATAAVVHPWLAAD